MMTMDPSRIECVVRGADQLGETPLWCERERKLWWLDIERPKLQSFDPANGRHEVHHLGSTYLGSQALGDDGSHLLALDLEAASAAPARPGTCRCWRASSRASTTGSTTVAWMHAAGSGSARWTTSCTGPTARSTASIRTGRSTRFLDGVIVSNGIAFSPDNKTLYFTDTRRHLSWQFDFDLDDGRISNQRLFADYSRYRRPARRRLCRRRRRHLDGILRRRASRAVPTRWRDRSSWSRCR